MHKGIKSNYYVLDSMKKSPRYFFLHFLFMDQVKWNIFPLIYAEKIQIRDIKEKQETTLIHVIGENDKDL